MGFEAEHRIWANVGCWASVSKLRACITYPNDPYRIHSPNLQILIPYTTQRYPHIGNSDAKP